MKKIIIIPARYDSKRLPGKPLATIHGKPMIRHVVKRCLKVSDIDEVWVATDNVEIMDEANNAGANAAITSCDHKTGSDRIADVAFARFDSEDLIINVQGDMPFVDPRLIEDLIQFMVDRPLINIVTPATKLSSGEMDNPSIVKVAVNANQIARDFSRGRPIGPQPPLHHLGVYAYWNGMLQRFSKLEPTHREMDEELEQLRALENGMLIGVMRTDLDCGIEINTPQDLEAANSLDG